MARNRRSKSASAQAVISLARLPASAVVFPTMAGKAERVATTSGALVVASLDRNVRAEVRIVGSLVDSTITDLILTPLLLYGPEPVLSQFTGHQPDIR